MPHSFSNVSRRANDGSSEISDIECPIRCHFMIADIVPKPRGSCLAKSESLAQGHVREGGRIHE